MTQVWRQMRADILSSFCLWAADVESNEQFAAATQQCPETVFDVFEEHKEPPPGNEGTFDQ